VSPKVADGAGSDGRPDRVLIAGVGNVFLGDDGFGVEVVQRIDRKALPPNVDVVDYGIRGVHLAYELLGGRHHTLILVDAMPVDGPPGTLSVLEVEEDTAWAAQMSDPAGAAVMDGHGMDPHAVVNLLSDLGGRIDTVLVVGCRPAVIAEHMGLSEPVRAAVPHAARLTVELACDMAQGRLPTPPTRQATGRTDGASGASTGGRRTSTRTSRGEDDA